MSIVCGPCAVGYHWECKHPSDSGQCHCTTEPVVTDINDRLVAAIEGEKKERGGQIKDLSQVKDLESTGRKRAAKLYPIAKEGEPGYPMACEWRGLLQAGGGVIPLVGCIDGLAKDIHHGPDKNTLSNFVGNVHRICKTCHNRWHTLNDKYYLGERPMGDTPYVPLSEYDFSAHALLRADKGQLAASEAAWGLKNAATFLHNLHQELSLEGPRNEASK